MADTDTTTEQQTTSTQLNTETTATSTTAPAIDYEKIEGMINKGAQQKESAILKSYFEQQGMTEDEVKQAVSSYKTDRAKKAEEDKNTYATMQKENEQLKAQILQGNIERTVSKVALDMGIDKNAIPYLSRLIDNKTLIGEKGEVSEDATKSAIEQIKKDFPALGASQNSNAGFTVGANNDNNGGTDENELRKLFGLKPKSK